MTKAACLERKSKKCGTCKEMFSGKLTDYFYRNVRRADGLSSLCKGCQKKASSSASQVLARKRREKKRYEKNKWKAMAREQARKFYGDHVFQCSVITCFANADEFHHVDYEKPLDVVPLCQKHHKGIHE